MPEHAHVQNRQRLLDDDVVLLSSSCITRWPSGVVVRFFLARHARCFLVSLAGCGAASPVALALAAAYRAAFRVARDRAHCRYLAVLVCFSEPPRKAAAIRASRRA